MRPLVPRRALATAVLSAALAVSLAGCPGRPSPLTTHDPADGAGRGRAPYDPQTPFFRDVAAEAGIDFRWGHGGKSPLTIIETIGHGCAFLDYDQDGWLDVFLVGNRKCALFRNRGSGRFSDVTAESGLDTEGEFWGVAAGDYDNDGYPDLYITGYGKCVLYHNVGRGAGGSLGRGVGGGRRFEDVTAASGLAARGPYDVATAAAFADLDGDGRQDLFAGRYIVFTPTSLQFCTYGGVRAGCGVKNYDADKARVYRNNGGGSFTDVTEEWGFGSTHGKCLGVAVKASEAGNGVEVYAANDELPADLFARAGDRSGLRYVERGTLTGTAYNQDGLTQGGMGTDWGDFDNDGRPDLVVSTFQGEANSLYRADTSGVAESKSRGVAESKSRGVAERRSRSTPELPNSPTPQLETRYTEVGAPMGIAIATSPLVAWTAKFFDFDNDRWLDLLFTNGHTQDNVQQTEPDRTYPQRMLLYRNEEGKRFVESAASGGPAFGQPFVGRGAAAGDFDNDGRIDLLVVDEEGPVKLLKNEDRSGHHWIGVTLVGVHCNRDGIGARVSVTADGMTTVRDQQLAGGYISAHDPRVHFGLGKATRVDKLVVRWPCGHVDTMKKVPVDRYIVVREGK